MGDFRSIRRIGSMKGLLFRMTGLLHIIYRAMANVKECTWCQITGTYSFKRTKCYDWLRNRGIVSIHCFSFNMSYIILTYIPTDESPKRALKKMAGIKYGTDILSFI